MKCAANRCEAAPVAWHVPSATAAETISRRRALQPRPPCTGGRSRWPAPSCVKSGGPLWTCFGSDSIYNTSFAVFSETILEDLRRITTKKEGQNKIGATSASTVVTSSRSFPLVASQLSYVDQPPYWLGRDMQTQASHSRRSADSSPSRECRVEPPSPASQLPTQDIISHTRTNKLLNCVSTLAPASLPTTHGPLQQHRTCTEQEPRAIAGSQPHDTLPALKKACPASAWYQMDRARRRTRFTSRTTMHASANMRSPACKGQT